MTCGPGKHAPGCMCDAHVRQRQAGAARVRVRAQIGAEQDRQREMLEGAMAVLENLAAINAGGAEITVSAPAIDDAPPCTCRAVHSPWPAAEHGPSCPQAVPGLPECWCNWCKGRAGVHGAEARALYRQEATANMRGTDDDLFRDEPAALPPAPDPLREHRLVMDEPLILSWPEVEAAFPDRPPGTCESCRQPAPDGKGLCWYCAALRTVRAEAAGAADATACARPPAAVIAKYCGCRSCSAWRSCRRAVTAGVAAIAVTFVLWALGVLG